MSIADKITRLQTAKSAIATAITGKGGTVGDNDGFEEFAAAIASIPSGGGEIVTKTITPTNVKGYSSYLITAVSKIGFIPKTVFLFCNLPILEIRDSAEEKVVVFTCFLPTTEQDSYSKIICSFDPNVGEYGDFVYHFGSYALTHNSIPGELYLASANQYLRVKQNDLWLYEGKDYTLIAIP